MTFPGGKEQGVLVAVFLLLSASAAVAQTPPATTSTDIAADGFNVDSLPAVVATVNGIHITKARLLLEAQAAFRQLAARGDVRDLNAALYREALHQIIAGILLHAEARVLGIAATEEEIEAQLRNAKEAFPSEEVFLRSLAERGDSEQSLRNDFAQETSIRNFLQSQIRPTIVVTEAEAKAFYDNNQESLYQPERVKVRHLLIALSAGATDEEKAAARRQAEGLLARARQGEDFAALVNEYSDDESNERGGELPWLRRGQTLPAFEAAAFALAPGEISDIVETGIAVHIIQGIDRVAAHTASFEEAQQGIVEAITQQKMRVAMHEKVEQLKARAQIERFALKGRE